MEIEILKLKLKEAEDLLDFSTSAIEVAANSCAFNNNFAEEDILRLVLKKQYDILDKISYLLILSE